MTMIANTQSGQLRGREKDGVLLFAGIPYAAPPVDGRRFRAAAPHEGWSGVRDARKFGPGAPQVATGRMADPVAVRWDEDCLTLNVQTTALDDAGRPVLFWIHGGAYRIGQGALPWYNGARFCANGDIVTVTINYRLGALGFTDLSRFGAEFATSGVNGLLDQITALEWVRENIAQFGGDPGKGRQVRRRLQRGDAARLAARAGPVPPRGCPERRRPQRAAADRGRDRGRPLPRGPWSRFGDGPRGRAGR